MASTLVYRHIFGFKGDTRGTIYCADDSHIVYTAGHSVIKHNVDTRLQEFIHGNANSTGISSLGASHSRRYMATAERGKRPSIGIYNLKRLYRSKTLELPQSITSETIVSVTFNNNDTQVVALIGPPDWAIVVWALDKGTIAGYKMLHLDEHAILYSAVFDLSNKDLIAVHGRGYMKLFGVENDSMVEHALPGRFASREPRDYTSLLWLAEDRLLIGTGHGEILYFADDEFLGALAEAPDDGIPVTHLVSFSRGFVAGSGDGSVRIYEVAEIADVNFTLIKRFRLSNGEPSPAHAITCMDIPPDEEFIAISTAGNALLRFPFATSFAKEEVQFTELIASHGPSPNDALTLTRGNASSGRQVSESCGIFGLDVCVRKPLIVTSGHDNTIRVWNFTAKTQEISKTFADHALSVAFHPSGLHILAGFSDKLRYMNILLDDLRTMKEINIKNCRECRFSTGGHIFAAANVKLIQVYNSYTCEMLHSLRGHSGSIRSISFTPNDRTMLSAGIDGRVYSWSTSDGKRVGEYVAKDMRVSGATPLADGRSCFVVGTDGKVSQVDLVSQQLIRQICGVPETNGGKPAENIVMGQVALGNTGILVASTAAEDMIGSVFTYPYPIGHDKPHCNVYPATSAPVVRLALTHDSAYLFAAGADGTIVVFEVRDKDGRLPFRESTSRIPWSDEVLVTRSDLEDMAASIAELEETQEELQSNNEYALRMREIAFQEDMKKLTERYSSELEQEKQQFELLREEKMDVEREFGERIAAMEVAHRSEMQKREGLYQEKIMEEVERYQQLELECQQALDRHRRAKQDMMEQHENRVNVIQENYEKQLQGAREQHQEMADDKRGTVRDWEETRTQMEQDLDEQVENMRKRYETKLEEQKQVILKCKSENGIMKKKFASLSKDIEDQQEEIQVLEDNKYKLDTQITSLGKEIDVLKTMIREKDATIGEKEKRIYELKKKNQELEKFKFVLDYKIRELKRQIEPREQEIASMREQIKEVDTELEAFHKSNAELDETIGELRKQLDQLHADIAQKKTQVSQTSTLINDFHSDLFLLSEHILVAEKLQQEFLSLHNKYVPDTMKPKGADEKIVVEYERQKKFLESNVSDLKQRLSREVGADRVENRRIMQENMDLIHEISTLRQQAQQMRLAKKNRALTKTRAQPSRNGNRSAQRDRASRISGLSANGVDNNALSLTVTEAAEQLDAGKNTLGVMQAEVQRLEKLLLNQKSVSRQRPSQA